MRRYQKSIILTLIVFTLLYSTTPSKSQITDPSLLIIYENVSEKAKVEQWILISNFTGDISTVGIANINSIILSNYDIIIFSAGEELEIEDNEEARLVSFMNLPNKLFMLFTPFVDEFGDALRSKLGIEQVEDIVPQEEYSADWIVRLDQKISNYTVGDTFDYQGELSIIIPTSNTETVASVVSVVSNDPDIDDLQFPYPVILNATQTTTKIIVGTMSVVNTDFQLHNHFISILSTLIPTIIMQSIDDHVEFLENVVVTTTSDSTNTSSNANQTISKTDPSSPLEFVPPQISQNYLLISLGALLLLFATKIFAILRWLLERIWLIPIGIIGAFYNIQERSLEESDVFLNQSRVELLEYLENLKEFGSHVSELKSVMGMGTGSLLWHLQVLEDFGYIQKHKIGRNIIFVAYEFNDRFDPEIKEIEMNLQSKNISSILTALTSYGMNRTWSIVELGEITGTNNRTLRRIVNKMDYYEIIEIIKQKPISFKVTDREVLNKLIQSIALKDRFIGQSGVHIDST